MIFIAPIENIAGWLPEFHMAQYAYTTDWSDDDVAQLVAIARHLQARPLDLAACWMSESALHTTAHNPNGDAVGIFQAMPKTLQGMGYQAGWKAFAGLPVSEQLHWAERYYAPHAGQLNSPGACYLCTFLPALMAHADEPAYVLCSAHMHADWYFANRVFDQDRKGYITVWDLTARINQVTSGPRWQEFAARVRTCEQNLETDPGRVRDTDHPAPPMCEEEGSDPTEGPA